MSDEKEVWKTYPDYDFIEVSNLGRIRTRDRYVSGKNGSKRLVKGRVLKPQHARGGYLRVNFCANGKFINLLVHRAVATCFIPNPLGLPEANHKDNNRINNTVSNLEWCDRQYNIAYREKYGKSATEVLGRPVFAVNLETCKVLWFESQSEAARQLGIDESIISRVVKGERQQTNGYWFTEDESEITEEKIRKIKNSIRFLGGVIAINLDTSTVFLFESQHEAACQLGADSTNISKVVNGKLNQTHNYWFCNVDETAIEKVRAKFGDKIAEKVEKLISENKKVSESC